MNGRTDVMPQATAPSAAPASPAKAAATAAPDDARRLADLLAARHACISINTFEESYALEVIRQVAVEQGLNARQWSVTLGLRDALIEGAPPAPHTDHPAAALFSLSRERKLREGIVIMLDLCGHLRDERTLRALREAVDARSAA